MIRYCPKCDEDTERDKYGKCKPCHKRRSALWLVNNREKANEKSRRWSQDNPERMKELQSNWRDDNKERIQETDRLWTDNNRDHLNEVRRNFRRNNPEQARERDKKENANVSKKKRTAHNIIGALVRAGKIPPVATLKCVDNGPRCLGQADHYHHEDDDKPKEVEPLCRFCHAARKN